MSNMAFFFFQFSELFRISDQGLQAVLQVTWTETWGHPDKPRVLGSTMLNTQKLVLEYLMACVI